MNFALNDSIVQLDTCIFCKSFPHGMVILNPMTNTNELILYPMTLDKLFYYQSLVIYYYKSIVGQLLSREESDEMAELQDKIEDQDDELLRIKAENQRLKQSTRDTKRHNEFLLRDLKKLNPEYQPPKIPKAFVAGAVIFPPGTEFDEEVQFGYNP